MRGLFTLWAVLWVATNLQGTSSSGHQPLSKIAIHQAEIALDDKAYVKVSPSLLGLGENGAENSEWVTVEFHNPNPTKNDWIGVFSPANFSSSTCSLENPRVLPPVICTAPIKYQLANFSNPKYAETGTGSLKLQLINQRADFSFALFTDGLLNPKLVAISNTVTFANPKAPVYPRLAQGRAWDEMTVTWTSGYEIGEAFPVVEWGLQGKDRIISPAGTLTFDRSSLCDTPTGLGTK